MSEDRELPLLTLRRILKETTFKGATADAVAVFADQVEEHGHEVTKRALEIMENEGKKTLKHHHMHEAVLEFKKERMSFDKYRR